MPDKTQNKVHQQAWRSCGGGGGGGGGGLFYGDPLMLPVPVTTRFTPKSSGNFMMLITILGEMKPQRLEVVRKSQKWIKRYPAKMGT